MIRTEEKKIVKTQGFLYLDVWNLNLPNLTCLLLSFQQTVGRLFKMVKNKEASFTEDAKIKELLVAIAANSVTPEETVSILTPLVNSLRMVIGVFFMWMR